MEICDLSPGVVGFIVNLAILGFVLGACGLYIMLHTWWRNR